MGERKVSVIVPAYNIQDYIGKCVDSILNQSYKDLEVILVDDGSTDNTLSILKNYQDKDDRVKLVHQENKGLSGARNSGLDISIGEFVYFVDGDDRIHPLCIEKLLTIAEEYGCDIVQCGVLSFLEDDNITTELEGEKVEIVSGKNICRRMILSRDSSEMTVVWNKLYRRSIFDNKRFTEGMVYEDTALTHELFWKSNKVAVTNQTLAFYRSQRRGSITHSNNKKIQDAIKADSMRTSFFEKVGELNLYYMTLYVTANDYVKLKINDKNLYSKDMRNNHKEIIKMVIHGKVGLAKKLLAVIGYSFPRVWFAMWSAKKRIEYIEKWNCINRECKKK